MNHRMIIIAEEPPLSMDWVAGFLPEPLSRTVLPVHRHKHEFRFKADADDIEGRRWVTVDLHDSDLNNSETSPWDNLDPDAFEAPWAAYLEASDGDLLKDLVLALPADAHVAIRNPVGMSIWLRDLKTDPAAVAEWYGWERRWSA